MRAASVRPRGLVPSAGNLAGNPWIPISSPLPQFWGSGLLRAAGGGSTDRQGSPRNLTFGCRVPGLRPKVQWPGAQPPPKGGAVRHWSCGGPPERISRIHKLASRQESRPFLQVRTPLHAKRSTSGTLRGRPLDPDLSTGIVDAAWSLWIPDVSRRTHPGIIRLPEDSYPQDEAVTQRRHSEIECAPQVRGHFCTHNPWSIRVRPSAPRVRPDLAQWW
jgi:hypothetical protein